MTGKQKGAARGNSRVRGVNGRCSAGSMQGGSKEVCLRTAAAQCSVEEGRKEACTPLHLATATTNTTATEVLQAVPAVRRAVSMLCHPAEAAQPGNRHRGLQCQ